LPVCPQRKNVREEEEYWQRVEHYQGAHLDPQSSQGLCNACRDKEPVIFPPGMVTEAMRKFVAK
jgi:hypothetical protein